MKKKLRLVLVCMCTAALFLVSAVPAFAATNSAGGFSVPANITVKVGESKTITVSEPYAKYSNVTGIGHSGSCISTSNSNWGTYKGSRASVTVTGKSTGTSYVSFYINAYNSKSATTKYASYTVQTKVTVQPRTTVALNSIGLSATSATMNVGNTKTLTVKYNPSNTTVNKSVSWSSSNSSVATVSGGKVTAKKAGTATITAKCNGKTATCRITVKVPNGYVNTAGYYGKITDKRLAAGKKKLTRTVDLENYAKVRAKELATKFSHTRPNGQKGTQGLLDVMKKRGVYSCIVAENIAYGQPNCDAVLNAWYNSAGHRANWMNGNMKRVGFAGYTYNGTTYWVMVFSSE